MKNDDGESDKDMIVFLTDSTALGYDQGLANKYPEYLHLVNLLNENQLDLSKWDALLNYLDSLLETTKTPDIETIKTTVHEIYYFMLFKFPFLVEYWKKFVSFEYQFYGLNKSVKVLNKSLELFPNSMELWLDRINIIISNNLHNNNHEFARGLYWQAIENCGRQFFSHQLWDSFLEWESMINGKNSTEYLEILLKVIHIPLHQYAKYSTEFMDLKNNFNLIELKVPTSDKDISELSIDEQISISDEFFSSIVQKTYELTTERWNFEKNIETQSFQLSTPIPDEELKNWKLYLNFEEQAQYDQKQVISLYERCLVPCCMYEYFWIQYLKYLIKNDIHTTSQDLMNVFNRAMNKIPKNFIKIRLMFARYLLSIDEKIKSFEILFKVLKQTLNGDHLQFVETLKMIVLVLMSESDGDIMMKKIDAYLNEEEQPAAKKRKIEQGQEDDAAAAADAAADAIQEDETGQDKEQSPGPGHLFDKVVELVKPTALNDDFKMILINTKLKTMPSDSKLKREFFLSQINNPIVSRDFEFLNMFVKFELLQRNNKNLNNLLKFLLNFSQLPLHHTQFLVIQILQYLDKNDVLINDHLKVILTIDRNSGIHHKKFNKLRNSIDDNTLIKQNGHVGIEIETELMKPMIANRLDFWESLTIPIPLPIYKNVEKASASIKYPKEIDLDSL